ncbi:MAG: transposase [Candidatus Hadarchaeales archaeon]
MREAFGRLKYPRLRILYENYLDLQTLRIALNNRVILYGKFNMLTPSQHLTLSRIVKDLERKEKEVAELLKEEVELVPVWNHWLSKVKGIGPVMGAGVITWIDDISRFPTVSKLWAYAVGKPGERREKNKKVHYNPKLKTLCWKIGMQFLKARGGYAELYRGFKAGYERREDLKKVEKGSYKVRIHLMALRKTVKIFLQHLWVRWRELEGLPVTRPYAIDRLGHTSYIPPIEDKEVSS